MNSCMLCAAFFLPTREWVISITNNALSVFCLIQSCENCQVQNCPPVLNGVVGLVAKQSEAATPIASTFFLVCLAQSGSCHTLSWNTHCSENHITLSHLLSSPRLSLILLRPGNEATPRLCFCFLLRSYECLVASKLPIREIVLGKDMTDRQPTA